MKQFIFAGLVLSAQISLAFAQTSTPVPTLFEEFAANTNAVVSFTQQIGAIDSSDSKAIVTALSVQDSASPSSQMRGVRIDLENNGGADHVYLDESQLTTLLQELAGIEAGISRLVNESNAPYRVQGTASCWMPDPAFRILCPSYRVGPDWSGFTLAAFGGRTFALPDHVPSELTELIERAISELEAN
jgi:hypothetical protein